MMTMYAAERQWQMRVVAAGGPVVPEGYPEGVLDWTRTKAPDLSAMRR